MKSRTPWIFGFLLLIALIPAQSQSADDELRLGIEAYKNSHYDAAIEHFRKATELNPNHTRAHMYLATALVTQYIPGVEDADNLKIAEQAIEQYRHVLDLDQKPGSKINCLKGIAFLYLNMKKWDEAKSYYQQASDVDPTDPEPDYAIGVIDWTRCYEPRQQGRARLGMSPAAHLNAKNPDQQKLCDELRVKNTATIEEGIESLNKAIQLRPDYDDAMAYMNLMYRERADLECNDPAQREQDLRIADEWVDKTMATKKAKAQKATRAQGYSQQ